MAGPDIPNQYRTGPTLDTIRNLTKPTVRQAGKNITGQVLVDTALHRLIDSMQRHLDIARGQSSEPDGYPTRASGSGDVGHGGSGMTPVERAVEVRELWLERGKDEHDRLTETAWRHVEQAAWFLAAASQTLTRLDGQRVAADLPENESRYCVSHMRFGKNVERDHRRGTVNCAWCQGFLQEWGRTPTLRLIEVHDLRGRMTTKLLHEEGFDHDTAKAG